MPTTLPTKKGTYVIQPGQYALVMYEDGDNLIINTGFTRSPGIDFTHPHAKSKQETYDLKSSTPSKHWWQESGTTHSFLVPRAAIEIPTECGWYYPEVTIGGQKIVLNTSGGSSEAHSWVDYIYAEANTLLNIYPEMLTAIANASIPWPTENNE